MAAVAGPTQEATTDLEPVETVLPFALLCELDIHEPILQSDVSSNGAYAVDSRHDHGRS